MNALDHLFGILSLSAFIWAIFGLYSSFRVGRFIIRRYEQETKLIRTSFFMNHFPFTKYLPDFFSSEIYTGHLIISLWGWRYFKGKKVFKDIKDPKEITKYFSTNEIKLVKHYVFAIVVFVVHILAYFVFRIVWPEAFS